MGDEREGAPPSTEVPRVEAGSQRTSRSNLIGVGVLAFAVGVVVFEPFSPRVQLAAADARMREPDEGGEKSGAREAADSHDGKRKGRRFDLRAYVDDGKTRRWAGSGQVIRAGVSLDVSALVPKAGFVVVLHRDADGKVSRVFPREADDAGPLSASGTFTPLELQVRVGEKEGQHHLVGVLCEESFAASSLTQSLASAAVPIPELREGCEQKAITLQRIPPVDVTQTAPGTALGLDPMGAVITSEDASGRDPSAEEDPSEGPAGDSSDDPSDEDSRYEDEERGDGDDEDQEDGLAGGGDSEDG